MTSQNPIEEACQGTSPVVTSTSRKPRPKYRVLIPLVVVLSGFVPLGLSFSNSSAHSVTSEAVASLYKDREYSALQDQKTAVSIGNAGLVKPIELERPPEASADLSQPKETSLPTTAKSTERNEQKIASRSGAKLTPSDTDSRFIMPSAGRLTSSYGMRWGKLHAGIDIAAPIGTPVVAVKAGIVIAAGMHAVGHGYGNGIDIRHPDGSISRYAHAEKILVRVGQPVKQGEQIMRMGCTGHCTGPHLHFEIHVAGKPVDPRPYLS
jgi:murein DD-endopeptidase MepM/ murein hydrolase activator NlpD